LRRAVKSLHRPGSAGTAVDDGVLIAAGHNEPTVSPTLTDDGVPENAHSG
jgi:hypothetical protein